MLSGYFLSKQTFNLEKTSFRISKIWLKTIFYSWAILILFLIFKWTNVTIKSGIISLSPVLFNEYWFITSFILLMGLTPILNQIILKSSKRELIFFTTVFLFVSGVQPLISAFSPFGSILNVGIMITSYLFAGLIREHGAKFHSAVYLLIFFISLFLQYVSHQFLHTNIFTYGIFPFICAASLFIIITRWKSFYNPVINWMASSVFASYLITSHPLINSVLWSKWINTARFNYPIISGLIVVTLLLFITVLIDQTYRFLEKHYFNKLVQLSVTNFISKFK